MPWLMPSSVSSIGTTRWPRSMSTYPDPLGYSWKPLLPYLGLPTCRPRWLPDTLAAVIPSHHRPESRREDGWPRHSRLPWVILDAWGVSGQGQHRGAWSLSECHTSQFV